MQRQAGLERSDAEQALLLEIRQDRLDRMFQLVDRQGGEENGGGRGLVKSWARKSGTSSGFT